MLFKFASRFFVTSVTKGIYMSDTTLDKANISLPKDFKFGEVDPAFTRKVGLLAQTTTSLGPLVHFVGRWQGNGFNTIFRPDNPVTPTAPTLPHPLTAGDNILELNLTSESLSFSPSLGNVPNRGTNPQGDVFLNGVPYLQAINDVTIKGSSPGIHVEPGLWMVVPPTTTPHEGPTVFRMASIPHGTTVEAQGTSKLVQGAPNIPVVRITPFGIGGTQPAFPSGKFPSQTAANTQTPRIPQDLTTYIANGTITQDILDDPNLLLRNHIKTQHITATTEITVSTQPGKPIFGGPATTTTLFGGGTDNIAFLLGDSNQPRPNNPNAHAIQMEATFWIETVEHTILVPPFEVGQPPLSLHPEPQFPGQKVPTFAATPPFKIPVAKKFTFTSTQIQYSQTVMLNFFGLSWPHVSVATLVPADAIAIPPTAWATQVAETTKL